MSLSHLSSLSIQLLLREPFYGHLLSALPKGEGGEAWPLLALSECRAMMRTPVEGGAFAQSETLMLGMLKHELLHLIFGHFPLPENIRYPGWYHTATDLVVNQYLRAEERPADSLELSLFRDLDLETGRGWRYYYEQLCTAKEKVEVSERLNELLADCGEGRHPAVRRHRYWDDVAAGPAEKRIVAFQIREQLRAGRQAAGPAAMGRLPGAVREALAPVSMTDPGIDWRRVLRLFAASSRHTRLKNTIRRPSKRYGTTPGIRVVRKSRLLVAVDTSASVTRKTLDRFFGEIHRLWRQGCEVMIVECDIRIQRKYRYGGRPPSSVSGRGGTLFDPPIVWANDHYLPDGLIYFTDAAGSAPSIICRCPLLWVIAGKEEGSHLPGRRVNV